jgi:hypothetical protein
VCFDKIFRCLTQEFDVFAQDFAVKPSWPGVFPMTTGRAPQAEEDVDKSRSERAPQDVPMKHQPGLFVCVPERASVCVIADGADEPFGEPKQAIQPLVEPKPSERPSPEDIRRHLTETHTGWITRPPPNGLFAPLRGPDFQVVV